MLFEMPLEQMPADTFSELRRDVFCSDMTLLIQETYRALYWYAYRAIAHWVEPFETAKDLVQEAYTRFFVCLEREPSLAKELTGVDEVARYLRGILKNLIHEFTRGVRRATSTISLQSILEQGIEDLEDHLQVTENWATVVDILAALKTLSPHHQRIIQLTIYGFSPETIATHLNSSPGAVRSSLYRIRHYLRQQIKEDCATYQVKVCEEEAKETKETPARKVLFTDFLPPAEARVFQLREVEDKSNREIASMLCMSETAVRTYYHRAKKHIAAYNQAGIEQEKKVFWTEERIKQLPEKQRLIVKLRYIDQLSLRLIAGQLDCSENAIQIQLCRAKKWVKSRELVGADQSGKGHRAHQLPPTHSKFLHRVPHEYRTEMQMFYLDYLSVKAIAVKRSVSEAVVRWRLVRGRRSLDGFVSTRFEEK